MHARLLVLMVLLSGAGVGAAASPGTDIHVPAAFRGAGAAGSQWSSRLVLFNPGSRDAVATISWLRRGEPNPAPVESPVLTVPAGSAVTVDDAVLSLFGIGEGGGAFRVVSDEPLVVDSAIINTDDQGRQYGQGFPGFRSDGALRTGERIVTHVAGVDLNDLERANVYGVATGAAQTSVVIDILDDLGTTVLASRQVDVGEREPFLLNLSSFGLNPPLDDLIVRFTVDAGGLIGPGVSVVNNLSGDPITRSAWSPAGVATADDDGRWIGFVAMTFDGGLELTVRDGRIEEVAGTLVVISPDDGAVDCSDAFDHGSVLATPVDLPSDGGQLSLAYTTQVDPATTLEVALQGTRFGPVLEGTVGVTISTTATDGCRGDIVPAPFTVAATGQGTQPLLRAAGNGDRDRHRPIRVHGQGR